MREKLRFLGLDVHAETIAVAVAEPNGEVRSLGTIANREDSIRKFIKKLGSPEQLRACYEAGPAGFVRLLMPSSFCLPPVECSRGTNPIQAANSRPLRKAAPLPMAATSAVAVSGPIPGIASRRRQTSLCCAVF